MTLWHIQYPLKEALGKTVVPHNDVVQNQLTENSFAVDLQMVLTKTADTDYVNPFQFFERTHMTNNLRGILKDTLLRVGKNSGNSILVIDTAFGGGKTHALLSIYHMLQGDTTIDVVNRIVKEAGLSKVPPVHLVTIDGRALSPGGVEKKDGTVVNTLWGEIAYQLGKYITIKRYDKEKRVTPGSEVMGNLFTSLGNPVVILLDELAEYLVKAKSEPVGDQNLAELTLAFLHELCQVVDGTPKCLLLVTLTSKVDPFPDEAERIRKFVEQIRKITTRLGRVTTPVEREEISAVVRKRLFQTVDSSQAAKVAKYLHGFYVSHSEYFPEKVKRPEYLRALENAYPFHPALIDILYERVSTIPEFHLTRGLLRLVSLIIKDVIANPPEEPVIMPYHVYLINEDVLHELTHKLQRGNLATVVRTDIVNANGDAQAQLINSQPHLITHTAATSLFLFSLIGNRKKDKGTGAGIKDITVCVSLPGMIHPSDVADVLYQLNNRLWYLHERSGYYYFDTECNINKMIDDSAKEIEVQKIHTEIKTRLQHLCKGGYFTEYVWQSVGEIRNGPALVLPYFGEAAVEDKNDVPEKVRSLLGMAGTSYRVNKNLIFVLAARKEYVEQVVNEAARFLAITQLRKDPDMIKGNRTQLKDKYKDENKALNEILELAYSVVYYAWKNEIKGVHVQDTRTPGDIQEKVYTALKREGKIVEELSPYFIKDRVLKEEAERFGDVYTKFLQTPALPYVREKQTLVDAVKAGVIEKHFGFWNQDFIPVPELIKHDECNSLYYGRDVNQITDECYIVSQRLAEKIVDQCEPFKGSMQEQEQKRPALTQKIQEISEFTDKKGTLLKAIRVDVERFDRLGTIRQLLNNVYVGSDAQFTFHLTDEWVSFQVTSLEHSHLMGVFEVLELIQRKILRKNEIKLIVMVSSNLLLEEDDIDDLKQYLDGVQFVAEIMR